MKHKNNDIVECFGRQWTVTNGYRKDAITGGPVYDLEALTPDENGYFETTYKIPEGFINIKNAL